jgi:spore coat protein SA
MPEWYHSISVLLITSTSEVHPCVYYEALASGRPVVSTLVGDIPATADNYWNGVYFPVDAQESEFAWEIRTLRTFPATLSKMGERARRTAEEKWSWERIAPKYISYAEEVNMGNE